MSADIDDEGGWWIKGEGGGAYLGCRQKRGGTRVVVERKEKKKRMRTGVQCIKFNSCQPQKIGSGHLQRTDCCRLLLHGRVQTNKVDEAGE